MALILGIETSCDDTSVAVLEGTRVLSLVTQDQLGEHREFGGVVPEIASRRHIEAIAPVYLAAVQAAGVAADDLEAVAVTRGPGLAGSLLVGLSFARGLAFGLEKPLVGVNHLEAHVYGCWLGLGESEFPELPAVCLVASGGHTELTLMRSHGDHRLLGRTRDDAAGEAFDKVARALGLGFPGGPAIEKAALGCADGVGPPYRLPRAWLEGTYDFSFSGLKTAVFRAVAGKLGPEEEVSIFGRGGPSSLQSGDAAALARMAAGFQNSIVEVLIAKTTRAAVEFDAASVLLAGGVAANSLLRSGLEAAIDRPLHMPEIRYCTDNGAMVAMAGEFALRRPELAGVVLDVEPALRLAAGI